MDYAGTKIIEAKSETGIELTQQNFRRSIARVIAACAIKQLPDELLTGLCYNLYTKKYARLITLAEFDLAFELNLTGDLPEKINHYQVFSAEFMCDVLNAYLQKQRQANIAQQRIRSTTDTPIALPIGNLHQQLLQQLRDDYLEYHATGNSTFLKGFPLKVKVQALTELFEVNQSEAQRQQLQQQAQQNIIRQLHTDRHTTRGSKFGRCVELERTLTRFKTNQLNPTDIARLQSEIHGLTITSVFNTYSAPVFLGWLRENED